MIYGWDISTSIVGLAVLSNTGEYQHSFFLDLRKVDGQLAKADTFKEWLISNFLLQRATENYHFIEERLMGFAGGKSSQQVMMKLAQFNAICSYILWTHDPGPHRQISYLHPSSWKATLKREGLLIPKGSDKKLITLEWFKRKQPIFTVDLNKVGNPQPWNYDMADAYCIGRAGYLRLCTERGNSQP